MSEKNKNAIYEMVFNKKYLDKQKRECNENIRSWLQAMVDNNKYRSDKHVKESIDYAESLIALSKKNELEQIAMIHAVSHEKLDYIYSEQCNWVWELLMEKLYTWYPQYKSW